MRRNLDSTGLHFFIDDGEFRFKIRLLQVGRESPLEARQQSFLKSFQVAWRAIARHDDLLSRLMKLIENIEKYLLRFFTTRQKLNVIQNEQVYLQVEILKLLHFQILQGVQKLIGKIILVYIKNNFIRHVLFDLISDGLHQVSLAHTHASVKHQRIK